MTMFLSGSMLSGTGGAGGGLRIGQQDTFTVHALRRDDDYENLMISHDNILLYSLRHDICCR